MTRTALVMIFGILAFVQSVDAQVVTVNVKVKSIKLESRGLTVIYKTELGEKTATLDVSRKATITINGEEGSLEGLKPGHEAKVEYQKDLAIITKIEAKGNPASPKLVPLPEIKGYYLSLTDDGLSVFWEAPGNSGPAVFTARRDSPDGYFVGHKELFPGRHPAVSGDGLELIFLGESPRSQDRSLYVTKRESADGPFPRAEGIRELRDVQLPKSPFLSSDGLFLCFNQSRAKGQTGIVFSTRPQKEAKWSAPKPLVVQPTTMDGFLTWAALASDELTLLCSREGAQRTDGDTGNLMIWKRAAATEPFRKYSFVEVAGLPALHVRSPRFVNGTGELFFSAHPKATEISGNAIIKSFPIP